MTEWAATLPGLWRYGIHPGAVGLTIRALGRVDLPVGEALRIEMGAAAPGGEDVVHVQYYINTDAGGWALWISCAPNDLAAQEAALQAITPVSEGEL